jgi:hypothetical protein
MRCSRCCTSSRATAQATAGGQPELVARLVARGASPLALRADRESVVRSAHAHPRSALFQLVRRVAREAAERQPGAGFATGPFARRYVPRTDRGVDDLRRAVEPRRALDVVLVHDELKNVARALGNLVQAPRREADVVRRAVQDAARLLFLLRLHELEWTLVPFVFESESPWSIEDVPELAAPGTGVVVEHGGASAPPARWS